jgi:hypothetical protein
VLLSRSRKRYGRSATKLEPLVINTAGSLKYRPDAQIQIPNLFLASEKR